MQTERREHPTARPLLATTDPLGPVHDPFPVQPTTPKRPDIPQQRDRQRKRQKPQPHQHNPTPDDGDGHIDDYA